MPAVSFATILEGSNYNSIVSMNTDLFNSVASFSV